MELPEKFKESMKDLLGAEYDSFIDSYSESPVCSLRINPSKISRERFEKIAPYKIQKIPFAVDGYYILETDEWSKHPYYHAGLYYIQEASAMLVADSIPTDDGDAVLDLCAAPGGKSTALSCGDTGILVSNDISRSRAIPLVKNLEHFGRGNYLVTCMDPSKLTAFYRESFDKVLVDAPCSGEGMFRKDPHLMDAYHDKGPGYYQSIQRDILGSAYEMTKPGGMIMYSTCTFSDIEDEQTVLSFLKDHPDVEMVRSEPVSGLLGKYAKYKDISILDGCLHAFPHKMRGEGHFLALMSKKGIPAKKEHHITEKDITVSFERLPGCVRDFLGTFSEDKIQTFRNSRFIHGKDGMITMLPDMYEGFLYSRIRYLRTGTCIGGVNGSGRFTAHTALALASTADDHKNVVNIPSDDIQVYKYLKGETVITDDIADKPQKGYVMVCTDGFPLGFAKSDGVRLKNLYEKGWISG